jgi:aminoglycoside phosphotransferase (APT) family kinase protein
MVGLVTELPGLDLDALREWLAREHPDLVHAEELGGELIAGGKSNLTYRVNDGVSEWAVRRPPLGHVLPTAHDMVREFTVISALAPTDVPVPPPIALCTDESVLGAPFYMMEYVDGRVLDHADSIAALDADTAANLGDQLVSTLAVLHSIEPGAVGLSDFGRPDGFLERQLRRWHQQWQSSETRPLPIEGSVVERLNRFLPTSGAPAIVHGDYRLTNVIYTSSLDRIAAIVDWEMATLGDPLADVGLLHVYHELAEHDSFTMPMMDPALGFLSAGQLDRRYAELSGRDVSSLPWYVAFGYFKLAVIAEGIAARYLQGKTVGAGFERFGAAVPGLLENASHALDSL